MGSVKVSYKVLCLLYLLTATHSQAFAQLPVCSGPGSGMIYYITGNSIYNLDPTQPLSATNPSVNTITPPGGAGAIAVSTNINGPGPSPTFYVVTGANYQYYDGTTWVNTGHTAGSVNPGGGGGYLYSLVGGTGEVWQYDGTGNAKLLVTVTDFAGGGPFDMVADCHGNFYLLRTSSNPDPQYLRKYSPTGALLQSWTVSGATSSNSGGGMAIIGNKIYFNNGSGFWDGTIGATDVNFTLITASGLSPSPSDFSSCPLGGVGEGDAEASIDSIFACDTMTSFMIHSVKDTTGNIINWKVVNGTATITGTGDTVQVSLKSNARIVLEVTDTSACGSISTDTIYCTLVRADVDAGSPVTAIGCKEFIDTLQARLSDTIKGFQYNIQWQPQSNILSGGNTLSPAVKINSTTLFTISVSTPAEQGGCIWTDTVTVVGESQVAAIIAINDTAFCTIDTVLLDGTFSQTAYGNKKTYSWDLADGTTSESDKPSHMYTTPGEYKVRLVVSDSLGCTDTSFMVLNVYYPPYVDLGRDTIICRGLDLVLPRTKSDTGDVDGFVWADSSRETQKTVREEGSYILSVFNGCGVYTDTFRLGLKDCNIWFPNAFTPNGDGLNDIARIRSKYLDEVVNFTIIVVNRFGEVVFKTDDVTKGWDGTYKGVPAELGTYYYFIKYSIGIPDNVQDIVKGDLLLIR